jgi:MAF protein
MMIQSKKEACDLVLASGSPRRQELLEKAGWRAMIRPVAIQEIPFVGEAPDAYARRLALEKAEKASSEDKILILGADTIVIFENRILGKPQNEKDAVDMLKELQSKSHKVITAIALLDPMMKRSLVDICETDVPMRAYNEREIKDYIASGSPLDKAGAYGIQDEKFHPVEVGSMMGCYANVMGLPLCHLTWAMKKCGADTPPDISDRCMAFTQYDCQVYQEILQRVI